MDLRKDLAPGYWVMRGKRGAAATKNALRARARTKEECPKCHKEFFSTGLPQHMVKCTGPKPGRIVNRAHTLCPGKDGIECGRIKSRLAEVCVRCSGEMAELDRSIMEGRGGQGKPN